MSNNTPSVTVRYGLSQEARKVFAKALGHFDVDNYPLFPNIPDVHYVPVAGDRLRYEEVPGGIFIVVERHFLAKADGSLEIDLLIEVDQANR